MYQALYRKWRPKVFSDVVGQSHITETLRRQVVQDRLSHAYLFTGTRGTGKTTCAKILAKAVNCHNPVDGDPCGVCPACRGIDNGNLMDVLEMDAASNNGVDHVRSLRDDAVYSPASVKYRVYIIDEVHMLSPAAFNALLKIMEEPPAHLIFILATTELHKVPATILSRCQRFAFKRIQPRDIAARLVYVAGQEDMVLTEEAAALLSRLSDGALRDALSLLDQCGAAGGTVDAARVLDVLGLAGNIQTAELMGHVLRRDTQAALLLLDKLYCGGKDVSALLNELSTLTRDLLIRMTAPEGGAALLSGGYDTALMDSLTRDANPTRLIFMAGQLQSTTAGLPLSTNRRTDAELCLLRLCDESLCGDVTALAARITRLEEEGISAPKPAPPPERPAVQSKPVPAPIEDDPPWDDDPPSEPMVKAAPQPDSQPQTPASGNWNELAEQCKNRLGPRYGSTLDAARGTVEGDVMVIRCEDEFTLEELNSPDIAEVIREVCVQRLGRRLAVRFVLDGGSRQTDKLEELIGRGRRYDSFTVK